jgi:stage II sporulation protein D
MYMKEILLQILQAVGFGAVVPGLMFSINQPVSLPKEQPKPQEQVEIQQELYVEQEIIIPVLKNGQVVQMELEEYVSRVVLGEISTGFEPEAIKAQAVATRTYTLRCLENGKKHPQGAVCTDHRCCQAYKDPDVYLQAGGTQAGLDKLYKAVEDTRGNVLYYDGKLINATYFASSGGMTEDAALVWGTSYPYLQPVESPGEEKCGYFGNQVSFSPKELQDKLGVTLKGKPNEWFGRITYTDSGSVELIRIGGKLYTGVEIRKKLGLRSTMFSVETTADTVTFSTKGYGHRVGMSQYGADAMAVKGCTYQEILAHYYQGTELKPYEAD